MRILLIEDEPKTSAYLRKGLSESGFAVDVAADGEEGLLLATTWEFALLSLLARRRGEVLSRTVIAEEVWDMNFEGDSNVVDVAIRRIRAKVDDPFDRKLIETVRGMGYVIRD